MSDKRRVALSIGVGDARPLPFLPGALNGARAFHQWAVSLGYEATLVTDEERAVTIQSLRQALEGALKVAPIHRFVVYFAGHGLIRELEQGLWLLSDWRAELRAVDVEGLRRRLRMFGIQQVSIFGDHCRSLPPDVEAADLATDPVLGQGPLPATATLAIDKFYAAQDGSATFAIPGRTPEEDRCLFSGVLMEGLWGANPTAYSKLLAKKVTSSSLRTFLEAEVPRRAATYRWDVKPIAIPTFPEDDNVYFGDDPVPPAPVLPIWPLAPDLAGVRSIRSPAAYSGALESPAETGVARSAPATTASGERHDAFERSIREQDVPRSFETRSGFVLDGARVVRVWTDRDCVAGRNQRDNWWHVGERPRPGRMPEVLSQPASIVIELDSGRFAALVALPHFIGSVVCDERGVAALIYRPSGAGTTNLGVTARVLVMLDGGALRADAKTDLAVQLRRMKHVDPVLGVLSAYLYDSVGDVDSIRRTAFFYAERGQPIPYDIALLGQLRATRRDRVFVVQVPAVPQREPRTKSEEEAEWTYRGTDAVEGVVGGRWPWMRQGWPLLDDPVDSSSALVAPELIALTSNVRSGRFTTLDHEGAARLIRLCDLESSP